MAHSWSGRLLHTLLYKRWDYITRRWKFHCGLPLNTDFYSNTQHFSRIKTDEYYRFNPELNQWNMSRWPIYSLANRHKWSESGQILIYSAVIQPGLSTLNYNTKLGVWGGRASGWSLSNVSWGWPLYHLNHIVLIIHSTGIKICLTFLIRFLLAMILVSVSRILNKIAR